MTSFDLNVLMEGTIRQLRTDADYFSRLTTHPGEKGRLNESHLVRTMRRYLPEKFGIGTGFIVSGGDAIKQSRQCDIIIYDRANNVPFYASDTWQIFPIEMVYGVVEVKTTLNKAEIKDAFEKCVLLREMSGEDANPNKAYVRQNVVSPNTPVQYLRYKSGLPPRFFVFGYSGPEQGALKNALQEVTAEVPAAHLHGLCQLQEASALFARHTPYRPASERLEILATNGMLQFFLEMPKLLNSMLGVVPLSKGSDSPTKVFPYRPEHFDVVDLDHYGQLGLQN